MDLSTLMPQQRDIVTTLDRPLFVSAGAGSGKTFTLTRRILWALSPESGPFIRNLDQVLAITFTKDAAAEIRERVRGALIEEGMGDIALQVDDAWISTIHGMCSRILRAHALELGLDPEFSVLDESVSGPLMDRAVDAVIARERGGLRELQEWYALSGELDPSGFEAGTSAKRLVRTLLERASASRHGFDDMHLIRGSVDFSGLMDAYRQCLGASAKAAETARIALDALEAYGCGPQTRGDLAACMLACGMPRPSKAFPKEQVALLKAEAADAFINAYLALGGPALDELLALARAVGDEYAALKAERSALDNNDLLRLTYEALRDHPRIRDAYAGKFAMVMIDEFQDTDQQQVDLINFLTGEGGRALCTVGDAQQSIYRFRGAEVEVFRRAQRRIEQGAAAGFEGSVVKLVKNFRSHAEVLEYVARVFDDGQGGIMPSFLNLLPHDGRADGLRVAGASRRQALLVAGGTTEERTAAKAEAIAKRFRALADAGQPAGDMVLLLGGMTRAGIYADAIRAQGLDCVISGGSVFASTEEAKTIRALVHMLGNLADTAQGLAPVLASPLFALGVQEFLALATAWDAQTGETRRRNIELGILFDDDAPGFGDLPLLARARTVLRRALSRLGKDPLASIVRDVVNESGWMVRLAERGAEGRAQAANVLKAIDAVAEAEAELGNAPRQVALAYDRFLTGKQAPGALNEEGGNAVRIMTVHASKGLEFPVVAVSECFGIRSNSARMQSVRRDDGTLDLVALPGRFPDCRDSLGSLIEGAEVEKQFKKYLSGSGATGPWLDASLVDDVCATGSAAEAWLSMRDEEDRLALEERARLLYVAMTRAREVCLLAMDAPVGRGKGSALTLKPELDLTPAVLERILPDAGASLTCDRLVFDNAQAGDFELIALRDFSYGGVVYEANAALADAEDPVADAPVPEPMDSFTLVEPANVYMRVVPAERAPRDSYSYSSVSAELHEEAEDHPEPAEAPIAEAAGETAVSDGVEAPRDERAVPSHEGDPTALGSAFHAACQWLIELDRADLPVERADALCRYWGCTAAQRERFDEAVARWLSSDVRAEALAWPCRRAEVPFYSLGMDGLVERFGPYAEGAIDLLCTDPARPGRALLIDYKTGGTPLETPEQLQEKHALQASVYADVLHKAGYEQVTLRFVRVEVPDPSDPTQPQVVTYEL
jgi:ATP-dependent exoDNAse (exonuclease V) beta subunit